ncbi:MAG: GIY-YIG nuclease family protein, partial [Lentisphaeria bacterium]
MIDRQNLPNQPGVYVFRNSFSEVIYVGKAKSLRKRVSSYLLPSKKNTPDPKLRSLIHSIADVDTYVVKSETEALLLESQLIKKYTPRYNIDLRDDKRFLLIKLDTKSPFPRLTLAR